MTFNVDSKKLFDGLAEAVARVVREDGSGTPILKLDSTRPCVYEVVGNAAAKTDVPMLEVEVDDGLNVRLELEDARRVILMQKEWLKKEASRTEMYKQKYEDSEAQLEEERLDREYERQAWDEERKRLEKKIIQLEAQLVWEKENPRNQTIGVQINNTTSEVHSEMKVDEMKVEEMKVEEMKVKEGIGVEVLQALAQDIPAEKKRTMCGYFVEEKAINYRYKQNIEDLNEELRVNFRAKNSMPAFVSKVKTWNKDGVLAFKGSGIPDIFDEFIYCYYDEGELSEEDKRKKYDTFKKACSGWNPN